MNDQPLVAEGWGAYSVIAVSFEDDRNAYNALTSVKQLDSHTGSVSRRPSSSCAARTGTTRATGSAAIPPAPRVRFTSSSLMRICAAHIVVLAVMWPDVPQAVEGLEWEGQIVIDPTNDFDPSDLNGRTSSEVVADLVAPAR